MTFPNDFDNNLSVFFSPPSSHLFYLYFKINHYADQKKFYSLMTL
jgi:hypothetical protein